MTAIRSSLWLSTALLFAVEVEAREIWVGPGEAIKTVPAAVAASKPGDTILIRSGTYRDAAAKAIIRHDLTIKGASETRAKLQAGNVEKGILEVTNGATVTVEDVEFIGAKSADRNGAGIRLSRGRLTVLDSKFSGNENGILAAAGASNSLTVDRSEFVGNGVGARGLTHAIYANNIAATTVTNSRFSGTVAGHHVKSRARRTVVKDSTLIDSRTTSFSIDMPNAGAGTITGNVIQQASGVSQRSIIHYDNVNGESGSLTVSDNVISSGTDKAVGVMNHSPIKVRVVENEWRNVQFRVKGPVAGAPS